MPQQQQQQQFAAAAGAPLGAAAAPPPSSSYAPLEEASGWAAAAGSSARGRSFESSLPDTARDFLFAQLCRASGDKGLVSGQRLHTIFVENGLTFTTETFARMLEGSFDLDRAAWERFVAAYGPVADALYDRIATRSALRAQQQQQQRRGEGPNAQSKDVASLREELGALEEEEQALRARIAAVKQRALQVQRDLREEEARQAALKPNATEDRAKEWDMLQKYVNLRIRKAMLREEEAQINHQMALL